MTSEDVANRVWDATEDFGTKCGKFGGAATVEVVRKSLAAEGIKTSVRNVFIDGVPVEIDLVIPRPGARSTLNGLLFKQQEAAVVLEIKKSGSYGRNSLRSVRDNFKLFGSKGIRCAYLTIEERQTYRYRATPKNLGVSSVYTLYWNLRSDAHFTTDWESLVRFLRKATRVRK
jgi:hypothetical protein